MSSHHHRDDPGKTPGLFGPENRQTRRVYRVRVSTSPYIRSGKFSPWPSAETKYQIRIGDPLFRWAPELTTDNGVFSLLNNLYWPSSEFEELTTEEKLLFIRENLRFVGIAAESLPAHYSDHPQQQFITAMRMTITPIIVEGYAKPGNLIEWILPKPMNIDVPLIMSFRKYEAPTTKQVMDIATGRVHDNEYDADLPTALDDLMKNVTEKSLEDFLTSAFDWMRFKKHTVVGTLLNSEKSGPYNSVDIH